MVSHQRQRSPKRDFPYEKVTFSTSQNPTEFTLNIEKYCSVASQQNLPSIKSYFMSKKPVCDIFIHISELRVMIDTVYYGLLTTVLS